MLVGLLESRPEAEAALDSEVLDLGRRLGRRAGPRGLYRGFQDRAVAQLMADRRLREALFRVVDVAPACAGPTELAEHFDAMVGGLEGAQGGVALASHAAGKPISRRMVGRLVHAAVSRAATRFIVAESVASAAPLLGRLWDRGVASSVDLLGEASVSLPEAQRYSSRCDAALSILGAASSRWPTRPLLERDSAGPIPRVNLSVKVTALTPLVRPQAPERGWSDLATRLRELMRRARDVGAHLHVDMESFDTRELTLDVLLDLLAEREFAAGPSAGLVLQAYLRDSDEVFEQILERVGDMRRSTPLTIRLVKGAYWDHETIKALHHGWIPPVWSHKYESDRCFERLTRRLIQAYPTIRPAIASHNLRSVGHAVAYARRTGLAPTDLEIQVLRGLGDDLQDALVREGLRVRTYCPVGDMVSGMGYLVRRLLENSSNESFLASRKNGASIDHLLRRP